MLTYTIPEDLNKPLYQYIYECIAFDIKNHNIKADEKLPSKRTLAKQLAVSLITIENAYEQLLSEGYIYSIEKKGYYVSEIETFQSNREVKVEKEEELSNPYLIDLSSTNLNSSYFPFSTFSKITRKVLSEERESILRPAEYNGVLKLREAISKHLNEYLGMKVSSKQIVIGSGSEHLYSLLIQFFGKKHYALENPGHKAIASVYQRNELKHSFIDMDDKGINIKALKEADADIVHVSANHHYPTGITMPISRRYELLRWAKNNNKFIIEDDYDSELRLKGRPISPLFALDNNDTVIYLNTFSITLAPSFRIAYMVLPESLLSEYKEKMKVYHCTVPVLDQLILSEFISSKAFERHLNRSKKRYRDLKNEFLNELKNTAFYKDLDISEADSGLHLLIKYPYEISDKKAKEIAKSKGLKVSMLSDFYQKKKDSHTLLIRYVSLHEDSLQIAILSLIDLLSVLSIARLETQ
ncbi:MAG: PLP-dependent aminotransferase family protein [Erysipelotrichaceae bacterium]|nr:PLP-dependent aminotransferase family protein [Erysipelotrichaceae bacterium]